MVTRLRNDVLEVGGGNISGMIYSDIAARNAIPTNARHEGMVVRLKNGERYSLGANLTNSDWTTLPSDGYEFSLSNFGSTFEPDIILYVRAGGSDTNNDGRSAGSAFLTIQKALDVLPTVLASIVKIDIGPGSFAGGIVRSVKVENVDGASFNFDSTIYITGATTDLETVSVVTDNGLVPGKTCQRNIDIGAYSTTLVKGTHFIREAGFSSLFNKTYWILSGTSPNIVVVNDSTLSFSNATISTLATTITSEIIGSSYVSPTIVLDSIKTNFSNSTAYLKNTGCQNSMITASNSVRFVGKGLDNNSYNYFPNGFSTELTDQSFTRNLTEGPINSATLKNANQNLATFSGVFNYSGANNLTITNFARLGPIDFEGTARCITLYTANVFQIGDISCTGTGQIFQLLENSTYNVSGFNIIGTVTTPSSISDMSQLLNSSGISVTNSSTPSSDVVVGNGTAATTWASAPVTDANSLCRLT